MRVSKHFLPWLAALTLTGCAAYHLGPVNGAVAGAKTVEVQPFFNQTLQPRLNDDMAQALRERFQKDGTFSLVTGTPGDLVVSGAIRNYDREGLGYLNNDSTTTQNYRVAAIVHVVVRDRASGKVVLEKDVKGHTLINVGSDFASSERQAGPLLAADVAQNIVALLAEGSW
jgi:hypothetical protein